MLVSRSWGAKLGGVLKLDFSYAVIPICGGKKGGCIEKQDLLEQ